MDELLVIALDRSSFVQVVDHQAQRLAQALLGDVRQPVDALQLGAIVKVKPGHGILRRLAAGPLQLAGNPMKFSAFADPSSRAPSPDLDADRARILRELGL